VNLYSLGAEHLSTYVLTKSFRLASFAARLYQAAALATWPVVVISSVGV